MFDLTAVNRKDDSENLKMLQILLEMIQSAHNYNVVFHLFPILLQVGHCIPISK